jgi:hypothetical protein
VTVSSGRIIPDAVADRWSVIAEGVAMPGACTTTVPVVVTGSRAIVPSDFSTPLKLEMKSVESVVAVTVTRRRPPDLAIRTSIERPCISVEPVRLHLEHVAGIEGVSRNSAVQDYRRWPSVTFTP